MYDYFVIDKFKYLKSYKIVFRKNNQKIWNDVLENLEDAHFWYNNQELNYQKLVRLGEGHEDHDLSFTTLLNDIPISIFAFSISKLKENYQLNSHGRPVLAPLFIKNCSEEIQEKITETCFKICENITEKLKIKKWHSNVFFNEKNELCDWVKICEKRNFYFHKTFEAYVDLYSVKNDQKILQKKRVFKKVKENLWSHSLLYSLENKEWNKFKLLHLKMAGKKTRSDKTWESQLNDINNKKGFVVFLYDKVNNLVGGNYYRYEKNSAVYAVGVNDRNLFPKPISHYSFYFGIKELSKKNVKWLLLGDIPRSEDFNHPSDKEISIGVFKKKMCTDIFTKLTIESST